MPSPILEELLTTFRGQKAMADKAIAQLTDDELRLSLSPDTNSVAVIIKHVSGNMKSRWTDFLTTDGEKPTRDRDAEFVDTFTSRTEIIETWDAGWHALFTAMGSLTDADLQRTITIRTQPLTVARALFRQLDHYAYHVGQIVLTARILAGDRWQTLTIPRGGSAQYNQSLADTPPPPGNERAPGAQDSGGTTTNN